MTTKKEAAKREVTKGVCRFCEDEFDKSKMTQHLKHCQQRKVVLSAREKDTEKPKIGLFSIQIEGSDDPNYWMHIEMPAAGTLYDLDDFLRTMWFEHFEHLSGFDIDGTNYSSEPEELFFSASEEGEDDEGEETEGEKEEEGEETEGEKEEEDDVVNGEELLAELPSEYVESLPPDLVAELKRIWPVYDLLPILKENLKLLGKQRREILYGNDRQASMRFLNQRQALSGLIDFIEDCSLDVKLKNILKVGQKFSYTYDYGTSTDLKLRVTSEREGIICDEEDPLEVLALNVAPEIPCVICGKPATWIVTSYYNIREHAYCNVCVKNLKGDDANEVEEIENTPRTGVY